MSMDVGLVLADLHPRQVDVRQAHQPGAGQLPVEHRAPVAAGARTAYRCGRNVAELGEDAAAGGRGDHAALGHHHADRRAEPNRLEPVATYDTVPVRRFGFSFRRRASPSASSDRASRPSALLRYSGRACPPRLGAQRRRARTPPGPSHLARRARSTSSASEARTRAASVPRGPHRGGPAPRGSPRAATPSPPPRRPPARAAAPRGSGGASSSVKPGGSRSTSAGVFAHRARRMCTVRLPGGLGTSAVSAGSRARVDAAGEARTRTAEAEPAWTSLPVCDPLDRAPCSRYAVPSGRTGGSAQSGEEIVLGYGRAGGVLDT